MNRSKAPLALMEQLAMVVVFLFAATVCVQAFVHSGLGSRKMHQEDIALSALSTVSDAVRCGDTDVLLEYGLQFVPLQDLSASRLLDGREFEQEGLMVSVVYDLKDVYVWYADVTVMDADKDKIVSVRIAGQKGGEHE